MHPILSLLYHKITFVYNKYVVVFCRSNIKRKHVYDVSFEIYLHLIPVCAVRIALPTARPKPSSVDTSLHTELIRVPDILVAPPIIVCNSSFAIFIYYMLMVLSSHQLRL